MTVREKLTNMLVKNGMYESQANEVMKLAEPKLNELVDDYDIKFDLQENHYPSIIYKILFIEIKKVALLWIDDKFPNAWYRPMFK